MLYRIGDKIKSKKPHVCGGDVWEITRIGADYKLKCLKCEHVIMVDSDTLSKMIKEVIGVGSNE